MLVSCMCLFVVRDIQKGYPNQHQISYALFIRSTNQSMNRVSMTVEIGPWEREVNNQLARATSSLDYSDLLM